MVMIFISVYRLSFEIKKKSNSFVQVYTIFVGSFLSVAKATLHNTWSWASENESESLG